MPAKKIVRKVAVTGNVDMAGVEDGKVVDVQQNEKVVKNKVQKKREMPMLRKRKKWTEAQKLAAKLKREANKKAKKEAKLAKELAQLDRRIENGQTNFEPSDCKRLKNFTREQRKCIPESIPVKLSCKNAKKDDFLVRLKLRPKEPSSPSSEIEALYDSDPKLNEETKGDCQSPHGIENVKNLNGLLTDFSVQYRDYLLNNHPEYLQNITDVKRSQDRAEDDLKIRYLQPFQQSVPQQQQNGMTYYDMVVNDVYPTEEEERLQNEQNCVKNQHKNTGIPQELSNLDKSSYKSIDFYNSNLTGNQDNPNYKVQIILISLNTKKAICLIQLIQKNQDNIKEENQMY